MSHTLAEVSEITGKSQAILRKHIERGKLIASKDGNRVLIEDDALEAYQASDIFEEAAGAASQAKNGWEIGNIIARLPVRFLNAILDGLPTSKKAGSSKPWDDATVDAPRKPSPRRGTDPHWGFGVGYQHTDEPRWARANSDTWRLGDATFTWSKGQWIGGGVREGVVIHEEALGISPANPDALLRPLAPPIPVSTKPNGQK